MPRYASVLDQLLAQKVPGAYEEFMTLRLQPIDECKTLNPSQQLTFQGALKAATRDLPPIMLREPGKKPIEGSPGVRFAPPPVMVGPNNLSPESKPQAMLGGTLVPPPAGDPTDQGSSFLTLPAMALSSREIMLQSKVDPESGRHIGKVANLQVLTWEVGPTPTFYLGETNSTPKPAFGWSYVFLTDGSLRIGVSHMLIAFCDDALMAGEVEFDNAGRVTWWSNKTGTYRPAGAFVERVKTYLPFPPARYKNYTS